MDGYVAGMVGSKVNILLKAHGIGGFSGSRVVMLSVEKAREWLAGLNGSE